MMRIPLVKVRGFSIHFVGKWHMRCPVVREVTACYLKFICRDLIGVLRGLAIGRPTFLWEVPVMILYDGGRDLIIGVWIVNGGGRGRWLKIRLSGWWTWYDRRGSPSCSPAILLYMIKYRTSNSAMKNGSEMTMIIGGVKSHPQIKYVFNWIGFLWNQAGSFGELRLAISDNKCFTELSPIRKM